MNLNKQVEALVLSFLSNTVLVLSSEDKRLLIEHGYMNISGFPTAKSLKQYLDKFVVGKAKLPLVTQLKIDSTLGGSNDLDVLFSKVVRLLGVFPKSAGFVVTHDRSYYLHGISNLLDHKPYHEAKDIKGLLNMLDRPEDLLSVIESDFSLNPLVIKYSSEEVKDLSEESVLISRYFYLSDADYLKSGYLGVLAPKKTNYDDAIAMVEYIGRLLENKLPIKSEVVRFTSDSNVAKKTKFNFNDFVSFFSGR